MKSKTVKTPKTSVLVTWQACLKSFDNKPATKILAWTSIFIFFQLPKLYKQNKCKMTIPLVLIWNRKSSHYLELTFNPSHNLFLTLTKVSQHGSAVSVLHVVLYVHPLSQPLLLSAIDKCKISRCCLCKILLKAHSIVQYSKYKFCKISTGNKYKYWKCTVLTKSNY